MENPLALTDANILLNRFFNEAKDIAIWQENGLIKYLEIRFKKLSLCKILSDD